MTNPPNVLHFPKQFPSYLGPGKACPPSYTAILPPLAVTLTQAQVVTLTQAQAVTHAQAQAVTHAKAGDHMPLILESPF
jgi:hypothetical protein